MKNILPLLTAALLTISCKAEVPTTEKSTEALIELTQESQLSQKDVIHSSASESESIEEEIVEEMPGPIEKSNSKESLDNSVKNELPIYNTTKQLTTSQDVEPDAIPELIVESVNEVFVVKETEEEEPEELIKEEIIDASSKEEVMSSKELEVVKPAMHDPWNQLLQKNVSSEGKVDYVGMKSQISALDGYLANLSGNVPSESDLSPEAKAFWMNAYNAFTVKLILKYYPVGSITDLHGGKPWDEKWIKLGSKTYSLNNIEHDILRPKFNDGRVHFAVNCAAKSCPKLSNKAFTAVNSEQLLNSLTKAFINNESANTINNKSVELSKIFDWYGDDFGDLIGFLNKYSTTKIASNAAISFRDYDWALNSK